MPGEYSKRRIGLKNASPRVAVPLPGVGGYDYPRGPFGATGFPGSTPAAGMTHTQGPGGRRERQLTVSANQAEWVALPPRRANGTPSQPLARQRRSTAPEHRMTPIIGGAPGSQNVRNQIAQRYKARPELIRGYRPSPNPGKTGAHLAGSTQYHPVTTTGRPDGKPIPGMSSNPGIGGDGYEVTVQSRFVSREGSQEGYAMNRDLFFTKGGTPAPYPDSYVRSTGNHHLRGGRLTGERYFGAISDQQQIGLPSDAYGIARQRGPQHRPVKFEQPAPWTVNYYDSPAGGQYAPDMIHQSPSRAPRGRAVRRG